MMQLLMFADDTVLLAETELISTAYIFITLCMPQRAVTQKACTYCLSHRVAKKAS